MLLKNLLPDLSSSNLEITNIAINSKKLTNGGLFFALRGTKFDGIKFVKEAAANGAVAIICLDDGQNVQEIKSANLPDSILIIKSADPKQLLISALKKFYSPLPKNIFAITGTSGKTSTAEFTRQMLEIIGKKAASIGSLGVITNDKKIYDEIAASDLTTPDIVSLYKNLAVLKHHKIDDIAIEASSIGIEQGRLDGIEISAAIFTNFSQDHLDYHQTMENYFAAKMLLFSQLMQNALVVLNSDIKEYQKIADICEANGHRIFLYGKAADLFGKENIKLINSRTTKNGQEINFAIGNKNYQVFSEVIGDFMAHNLLAALSLINFYFSLSEEKLQKIIADFSTIKAALGRMQKIAVLKNDAQIYIDYSHKPGGLESILKSARNLTKGRLIVLFGCGGNRDTKKRPMMGAIAADLADLAIITDDNPRDENPTQIRREIIAGIAENKKNKIKEIDNRKMAIKSAIAMLQSGDVLIIAGKGHEKYQIIGEKKFPFDEEEIVKEALF